MGASSTHRFSDVLRRRSLTLASPQSRRGPQNPRRWAIGADDRQAARAGRMVQPHPQGVRSGGHLRRQRQIDGVGHHLRAASRWWAACPAPPASDRAGLQLPRASTTCKKPGTLGHFPTPCQTSSIFRVHVPAAQSARRNWFCPMVCPPAGLCYPDWPPPMGHFGRVNRRSSFSPPPAGAG